MGSLDSVIDTIEDLELHPMSIVEGVNRFSLPASDAVLSLDLLSARYSALLEFDLPLTTGGFRRVYFHGLLTDVARLPDDETNTSGIVIGSAADAPLTQNNASSDKTGPLCSSIRDTENISIPGAVLMLLLAALACAFLLRKKQAQK